MVNENRVRPGDLRQWCHLAHMHGAWAGCFIVTNASMSLVEISMRGVRFICGIDHVTRNSWLVASGEENE